MYFKQDEDDRRKQRKKTTSILVFWCKEQLDLIYCIVFASSDI